MVNIGKIKILMHEKWENQADLAQLLGKSRQAVSAAFKRKDFKLADLAKIADHYGVSVKDLIE